jgi:excisionase family DNA binding protein
MTTSAIAPLALTITDAVAYSRLSRSRLYSLIQTGELPSFTVGGRRMIYRAAIDAFFAKLTGGAG